MMLEMFCGCSSDAVGQHREQHDDQREGDVDAALPQVERTAGRRLSRRGARRRRRLAARVEVSPARSGAMLVIAGYSCRCVALVMNCMRRSWVASARATSPVIRPADSA